MVVINLAPLFLPRDPSAAQANAAPPPAVTPAGFTFWVSYLILLGTLAYAIYQALPSQRTNPLQRRIGYPMAGAYLSAILWIFAVRAGLLPLTVLLIFLLLGCLVLAFVPIIEHRHAETNAERWLVRHYLGVFVGWVTVITVANVTAALEDAGIATLWPSDMFWAVLILVLEAITAFWVIWVSRANGAFTLTVIWCFAGIAAANVTREPNPAVALTAGLAACVAAVVWVVRSGTPDLIESPPAPTARSEVAKS
jgi:hypothetical protein